MWSIQKGLELIEKISYSSYTKCFQLIQKNVFHNKNFLQSKQTIFCKTCSKFFLLYTKSIFQSIEQTLCSPSKNILHSIDKIYFSMHTKVFLHKTKWPRVQVENNLRAIQILQHIENIVYSMLKNKMTPI